ncbi:MAG: hypothetical protein GQ574_27825 [Crocinitomix sp.]|nr:hypothetical protein [Crocinitomix sp.]
MIKDKLQLFIKRFLPDERKKGTVNFLNDFDEVLSINQESDKEVMRFLWQEYGTCSFNNGQLCLINPNNYADIVRKFNRVSHNAIPILRTATGSFLIWNYFDDEWVITYLDVHANECNHRADDMDWLFDDLPSNFFWENDLNGEIEKLAIESFPKLSEEDCIGFIHPDSGIEDVTNMEVINHIDYLQKLIVLHNSNSVIDLPPVNLEMDKNLKLIIIEELIQQKKIVFDRKEFLANNGWTKYRIKRYENKPIQQIENHFLNLSLADYQLHEVTKLYYDSGPKIIDYIWQLWDWDNGDYFDIKSLDGIACLENLESLNLTNLLISDISPLTNLKKLTTLDITSQNVLELEPFYKLSGIKKLVLRAPYPEEGYYNNLVNDMEKKGIEVILHESWKQEKN